MTTKPHHVLVVDDNSNNLFAMRAILQRLPDCKVWEALSGEVALAMMIEQPVDLVLLDIQMPGMDGFEIARHMKMTTRTRHIPILFITAVFRAEEFARQGYEIGAVDYLTKPLDDSLLLNRVQLYLQLFDREKKLQAALADLEQKEVQLTLANRQLELRVLERTHELQQKNSQLEKEVMERALAQKKQGESEQKFRLLFEKMTSGWLLLQQEEKGLRLLEVNPALQGMIGLGYQQLVGYYLDEKIPEMARLYGSALAQVLHSGEPFTFEEFFPCLHRHFLVITYSLDKNRLAAIFTDISDRIRMEETLRQVTAEAESATRAKSEFLAIMSHEIRTPMNAILGMAELLMDTPLNTDQRSYVFISRSSGENLLQIIDDILDISKVEAGQMELRSIAFNPRRIVHDANEVIRFRAQKKGLTLITYVEETTPPWCLGDPPRLRQILINLLGNAVKFTDQGCIALLVSGQPLENLQHAITFRVVDTGIGIPLEKQRMVFEAFRQVDSTNSRQRGGTGLGLAICQRLVHLMNGTIGVTGQEGRGSTFMFTLPLTETAPPANQLLSKGILQGRHVLVKHDHPIRGRYLEKMLEELGVCVHSCDNERGLAECFNNKAGFSHLDALLIHHNQDDAGNIMQEVAQLRNQPPWKSLTVVVCGYSDDQTLSALAKQHAVTFLSEPLSQDTLSNELARLMAVTAPATSTAGSGPHLRILLVEDSEDNLLLIQTFLKKTTHILTTAMNGKEAVERFIGEGGRFDLVLMDIQMPIMDGYEATGRIRTWEASQGQARCPILALTAHAMAGDEEKSLEAGCDGHLTKPIRRHALLEGIERYAGHS